MRTGKILVCYLLLMGIVHTAMCQSKYKTGDQLEAKIGELWKPVTVVKVIPGKTYTYTVQALQSQRGPAKEIVTVSAGQLRKIQVTGTVQQTVVLKQAVVSSLHLGRYEFYSGIPSMYLGHLILLPDGKYKVAFDTDENNYDESGRYIFHEDTQTIEWTAGMFRNNNWGGKFIKTDNGFRIEFNKAGYAESK